MSENIVQKGQPPSGEPDKRGWLLKWTNYLKGYQKRWFVLSNGLLSYYRNQAEMAHTCRGTISLLGALIHTADSTTFVVSNGSTQTFHIRAHDEVERQSWVTALELAKAKAIRATESDEDDDSLPPDALRGPDGSAVLGAGEDPSGIARELSARFHDVRTCSELVAKHGAALHRSIVELETPNMEASKQLSERATLFRISCNAMMNACSEFMLAAQTSSARLNRALQHERDQKMRLQEVVEQLARQHDSLEKSVNHRSSHPGGSAPHETDEDEDHEFFDAQDHGGCPNNLNPDDSSVIIKLPVNRKAKAHDNESSDDSEVESVTETQQVIFVEDKGENNKMGGTDNGGTQDSQINTTDSTKAKQEKVKIWPHVSQVQLDASGRIRRTRVPDKPNYPLSLWSIMKNCIGKELSKIPIPVNFSEPLSMLQRLCEDYEYSSILDNAASCTDPCLQLAYVVAFTCSSYATTAERTSKPFNPLLFETYECDRMADLGWRAVSEQVSHHPPMVAQHCEGASGWSCWQEFTMTSKFRGKYLQIIPMGGAEVRFSDGNTYSWRKVSTTVHNIIVGKLWVDNHGDMEIVGGGNAAGLRAHIKYQPYSYFSKEAQRKVTGVVKDASGTPRYLIQGHWDSKIEIAPVTSTSPDLSVCKTGRFIPGWEKVPAPSDCHKYYYFTLLAAQLNEPEDGVAPTDSRLRPDQRLMEEGLWDEANAEKLRLEEKQRAKRRALEAECEEAASRGLSPPDPPAPVWFARSSVNGTLRHVYNGRYWTAKQIQDWSMCPDIF